MRTSAAALLRPDAKEVVVGKAAEHRAESAAELASEALVPLELAAAFLGRQPLEQTALESRKRGQESSHRLVVRESATRAWSHVQVGKVDDALERSLGPGRARGVDAVDLGDVVQHERAPAGEGHDALPLLVGRESLTEIFYVRL